MVNARDQNGLQYMVNYFGATDAHFRLQSPINKAAYLSCAKLLLDSGLDPNTVDLVSGETVLFDAIRFNDKDMVALLLNYVSSLYDRLDRIRFNNVKLLITNTFLLLIIDQN